MKPRLLSPLNDGWQFASPTGWIPVQLPHTFNAEDGTRGGAYFRGLGKYRCLIAPGAAGRQEFLWFEGCCLTARVRMGDRLLRQHQGGYTGFFVELPEGTQPEWLEVEVDNSLQDSVIPLSGDFTIFGGIYRPVHRLSLGAAAFVPSIWGDDGVVVRDQKFSDNHVTLDWTATLRSLDAGAGELRLRVADEHDRTISERSMPVFLEAGIPTPIRDGTTLAHPILWQGRKHPHRYRFVWSLFRDGVCQDQVEKRIGIRNLGRDAAGSILLNGVPINLHGVCKHQDTAGRATAVLPGDLARDLTFVIELGANAVRLAHYPHAQATYDLCDELGLLVWTEIPLVNDLTRSEVFRENTLAQLREMISQNAHHASIFCWGLFNELYSPQSDRWTELVSELHDEAKRLDPSRFTACAGYVETPNEIRTITDLLATNTYPGWYHSNPEDMEKRLVDWNASGNNRGVGVSEYGAGGNPWQHEEPPAWNYQTTGFWHPEEWQSHCHERHYEYIRRSDACWGSFIWVLFDFYSDRRGEGGIPGINDKGLVTIDRAIRKDAFYFYQAHWSDQPVVHITSKRNHKPVRVPRILRVYSNEPTLSATLNGAALDLRQRVFGVVWEFDLPALSPGAYLAEISGPAARDQREFVITPVDN